MIRQALLTMALIEFSLRRVEAQEQGSGDQSTGNIAFDLPDLTATVETPTGTSQLEAFKSTNNDQVLRDTTDRRTPELFWVSIGLPGFVKTADPRNQTTYRLFHSSNSGFSTYVEMMSTAQRSILAATAKTKYRVEISESQVVNLILSRFQCILLLYDAVGSKYILTGKVSDFRNFPLRMNFLAPERSTERKLFKKLMEGGDGGDGESMDDLQFDCSLESSGKLVKTNTLMVSVDQQQQIGLEEKLFGMGRGGRGTRGTNEEVYVTRDQMNQLATEMYATLNIVEDYQMPEVQFCQAFVDGLIAEVSSSAFAQVDMDTALASLSKYTFDIGADIQPDVIKGNIGRILEVQTRDSKSRIILNETNYRQFSENQANSGKGSIGGGFMAFKLSASADWANANSKSSISDDRSLSDQLRELNTASQQEIQWDIQGSIVQPKSLYVARLTKSRMQKTLTFNRIRIQTFNAPFQRNFAMYSLRAKGSASLLEQLTGRVTHMEGDIQQMRKDILTVKQDSLRTGQDLTNNATSLNAGLAALTGTVQQLSSTVSQMNSAVDAQVKGLGSAVQSVKWDLTASINALSSKFLRRCRFCVVLVTHTGQCNNWNNGPYWCSAWSDAGSASTPLPNNLELCKYTFTVECQV